MTVFANGLEVACKKQGNRIIAAFPDVCFTPPENPATPPGVPVPYPSFGFDADTDKGTGTVKIEGETVSQKNLSYYKKTSGTEAGCAAKKGIVSSKNTGKAYDQAWSGNVKMDGEPVSRFTDLAATNSNSAPNGAMSILVSSIGLGGKILKKPPPQCPCCKGPAHANQVDENNDMYKQIDEDKFYDNIVKNRQAKIDSIDAIDIPRGDPYTLDPVKLQAVRDKSAAQLKLAQEAKATIDAARAKSPPCPNLHNPANQGCGTHFKMTRSLDSLVPPEIVGKSARKKHYRVTILRFTDSVRDACIDLHTTPSGGKIPKREEKVNHMTPLQAGGCPVDQKNLIPYSAMTPECQKVDDAQTKLHEFGETDWV